MEVTTWQEVALSALNVAQTVLLALLAARGEKLRKEVNDTHETLTDAVRDRDHRRT